VKPWVLLLIGASLDLVVAAGLIAVGLTAFGAFMGVVAVVGFGLAFWSRARTP
jgi:hypothetical protein